MLLETNASTKGWEHAVKLYQQGGMVQERTVLPYQHLRNTGGKVSNFNNFSEQEVPTFSYSNGELDSSLMFNITSRYKKLQVLLTLAKNI